MSCGRCCVAESKDEVAVVTKGVRTSTVPGFDLPLDAALGATPKPSAAEPLPKPEPDAKPAKPTPDDDGAAAKPEARIEQVAGSSSPLPSKIEARTFNALIPKGRQKLGIDINYHDTMTLLVTKVNAGPVEDFNRLNPDSEIAPGDRITDVNGVSGDTGKMLEACKQAEEIQVTVKRCEERVVTLEKGTASDELGLSFEAVDGMTLLIVSVEEESLCSRHNVLNPEFSILKEDRVIGVNGARSNSQELKQAVQQAASWKLVTRRVWKKG